MTITNEMGQWGPTTFLIANGKSEHAIKVSGRDLWALKRLIASGGQGCTPISDPAPRWSGYVHNLRNMGVDIETIHEPHGGPFSGTHARYVLRSLVTRVQSSGVAA